MDPFVLKKIISNLVHIVPAAFIALLFALALLSAYPKFSRLIIFLITCSLLAFSSPPVSNLIVTTLERQHAVVQELPEDTALVLVLGSGHHLEPDRPVNSVLMATGLSRITEAVRLWKTRPDVHLMVSGAKFRSERSHADVVGEMARNLGVNEQKLVYASFTQDTADEIATAEQWLKDNELSDKRVVVVSSATHLPRAALLAQNSGLEFTMAPTDFLQLDAPWYRFHAQHLLDTDRAVHEYVGMLWARYSR